jgi:putative CocE/NonD family hydrolase
MYLGRDGRIEGDPLPEDEQHESFISDPAHPVPFRMDIKPLFIPRKYMADDQRQQSRRPDVLTFVTEPLQEAATLAGPIEVELYVSTTGTDADWVVKLIDVYPDDHPAYKETQDHISMGGYQQLVRGEVFRGRYRDGFEQGVPFIPNEVTEVSWQLQDILHTFKPGHRIMVQVHSSWFPYVDVNPQTFVPNIFEAEESDFQAQTHRLYQGGEKASRVRVGLLKK